MAEIKQIQIKVDGEDTLFDILDAKAARIASPAFTGTPTAPNYGDVNNSSQIATVAYVQKAIREAIAAAIAGAY